MSRMILGAVAATFVLGAAPFAQAQDTQIDLSPYVNQGFTSNGWFLNGGQFAFDLAGKTTTGNQGLDTAFSVANVNGGAKGALNFWYGLDNGSGGNLFDGVPNSITIPIAVDGVRTVYTLADNVFGNFGVREFAITFHGAGGDLTRWFVGGVNTRDYNTPNCFTTGCIDPPDADVWYHGGGGIVLERQTWKLEEGFGLHAITFTQQHAVDGAILAGLTVSTQAAVPEPMTWALMIAGFGLAGGALRRRQSALA